MITLKRKNLRDIKGMNMTGTTKTTILKARSKTKFCVRSRREYGGETKELLLLP